MDSFQLFETESYSNTDEDDYDEEAVSDTWHQDGLELEEGEITGGDVEFVALINDGEVHGDGGNGQTPNDAEVERYPSVPEARVNGVVGGSNSQENNHEAKGIPFKVVGTDPGAGQILGSPSVHGVSLAGPYHDGPYSGSGLMGAASSLEFEHGDAAVKRRRTKIKKNGMRHGTGYFSHAPVTTRSSPSIDLNHMASFSHVSGCMSHESGSPSQSQSSLSSSTELLHNVAMGKQIGFQIDKDNPTLLDVVNGGGTKLVPS